MKMKATLLMALAAVLLLMLVPGAAQAHSMGTPGNVTVTAQPNALEVSWDRVAQQGGLQHHYVLRYRVKSPQGEWFGYGKGSDPHRYGIQDGSAGCTARCSYTLSNGNIRSDSYFNTRPEKLVPALLVPGTTYEVEVAAYGPPGGSAHIHTWASAEGVPLPPAVTLSALEINNVTTGSTAPAYFANSFRPDEDGYLVNVLKTVTSVTVTPTATSASDVTIKVKLGESGTEQTVESGAASTAITLTPNTSGSPPEEDLSIPHYIYVTVGANNSDAVKTYRISVYQFDPVAFTTTTVADRVYSVGAPAPNDGGPLPGLTKHDFLEVSHTATGLPEGLHLVEGRRRAFIGGTPEAATNGLVTVTLTTTAPELGSSASLTFQVKVNSAPVFTASDVFGTYHGDYKEFKPSPFKYTIGQTTPFSVTLPAATGGTGTLTYQLLQGFRGGVTLASVDKIEFNSATRVLSIGVGTDAPTVTGSYGVRWVVTDENGATATIHGGLNVANPPTLPAIMDKSFTVGDTVKVELPKGSSELGESSLRYEVTPEFPPSAYWPDLYWAGYTLSGTAKYTGDIDITYSVTDINGVSGDSRTFKVTIKSGTNAPKSAPMNLTVDVDADAQAGTATLEWDVLPNNDGATGCPTGTYVAGPHVDDCTYYVVQVKKADESYPRAHPYVPGRYGPDSFETRDEGKKAYVRVGSLPAGDYTARVAGLNQDGAGPWSAEVTFTVTLKPAGGL